MVHQLRPVATAPPVPCLDFPVALIVTAFKVMVSFEVGTITELLQYCAGVLMLAFSSFLVGRTGKH